MSRFLQMWTTQYVVNHRDSLHRKTINFIICIKWNYFLLTEAGPLATGSRGIPPRPRHHTAQVPPVFLWREDSGLKMQEDLTGLERVLVTSLVSFHQTSHLNFKAQRCNTNEGIPWTRKRFISSDNLIKINANHPSNKYNSAIYMPIYPIYVTKSSMPRWESIKKTCLVTINQYFLGGSLC